MSIFNNKSESKGLRRHTKELEALPANANLKLDGSEWARLANQRLQRERRPQEDAIRNVLTSSQAAKVVADHEPSRIAVEHWFCPLSSTYEAVGQPYVRATELLTEKRLAEVLKDVEQSWTSSAEKKVVDGDGGKYWTAASSEYFEARHPSISSTRLAKMSGSFKKVNENRNQT